MAMHYEAAGNWKRAIAVLCAAARHAHHRQAYLEAAQLLQHSLGIAENLNDADRTGIKREIQLELDNARAAMGKTDPSHRTSEEIDGFWTGT